MSEEKKQKSEESETGDNGEKKIQEVVEEEVIGKEIKAGALNEAAVQAVAVSIYGKKRKEGRPGRGHREERKDEFEQRVIEIARVTRVMAGGKRMRFRACVALGNKNGKIAIGLAKGADVSGAVEKAVNKAKKNIVNVPIFNGTIPHEIYYKKGAAKILFKPARRGRGVIAGGVVRIILELAGIKNVTSKILGTNNKVNNVKCAVEALKSLKKMEINLKNNR
jgi:small subunit ribosomal protein S5